MGGAMVPEMGGVWVAEFVQVYPWLWAIFPLTMSLGGSFRPGGVGLVRKRFIGVWGDWEKKMGRDSPVWRQPPPLEMSMGGFFGPCKEGLSGGVIFGSWEDLRLKFGQGSPCLVAFLCVRNYGRLLWDWGV